MDNLKKLGLYSDLSYGDASQTRLVDTKGLLDVDDRELDQISEYLSEGRLLAVSPGLSKEPCLWNFSVI